MNKRGRLFLLLIVLLLLFSLFVFAAQQAACKFLMVVVETPEDEYWARQLQGALADEGVTLKIERAPEFGEVKKTLPTVPAFIERKAPSQLRSLSFPVTIPFGAAKTGEKHLVTLDELVRKSDFKQAQNYLAKNRGGMIPEDAAKIEQFLDAQRRAQENMIGELNNWLKTEQGQIYLHAGDGVRWYAKNKAPWWKKWPPWKGDEVDLERLVANGYALPPEFLKPVKTGKVISPDLSVFDYDSLQVMHILGLSPEAAQARDVQRIGAAYKVEVGLLDAGEHTPLLSKLVEEGVLTEQDYIQLRKGAPIVMGGMTDTQVQMRIIWQARDNEINAGVNNLVDTGIHELSFAFTDTDKFPVYNVKLTKERWDEFLDKHIYGSHSSKTQLPPEFKNKELQKELLEKIIKLAVREKGRESVISGKKYRRIEKDIYLKGYRINWILGIEVDTGIIRDFHFRSFTQISTRGR